MYFGQFTGFKILILNPPLYTNGSKQEILKSMDLESRHFKSIDLKSKSKYPNTTYLNVGNEFPLKPPPCTHCRVSGRSTNACQ